ncbi:glycosyltransferase [Minwuia thermotolerans]|uniref:Glycosyltransferase n=1 Tax=Minwuia thermotolerans TaxID=2056226 RepID=A0A2M9FW44_9PROT|nr:glycosyltransferase [Minwuia thermotolerans]PJK27663.1 glycosyltransferase [Minwuia thermotolerans]
MKIALVLPDLRGGGAERLSLTLAREFRAAGHTPCFIVMSEAGELLDDARTLGPVHALKATRVRAVIGALRTQLERIEIEALIANLWPLTVAAGLAVLRIPRARRPLVTLVEHNTLSRQYAGWGAKTRLMLRVSLAVGCRLADRRIAVSHGVASDIARLAFMSAGRFEVIHNPVPALLPDDAELARAEAIWGPRNGRRILSVGSFKRQKNQALLIAAFAQMRAPGDTLMLLGEGQLRLELGAVAREAGVAEAVLMPGFHSDPTPFYLTADLFVLSSDYEGFGNVIVEAMACGTPVVSTDCPSGPAEILKGGQLGRLVPVGDASALAQAMVAGLDAPGDPAPRRARAADFAPGRIAARYLETLFPPRHRAGRG